jgi:hypothetical protein
MKAGAIITLLLHSSTLQPLDPPNHTQIAIPLETKKPSDNMIRMG